MGIDKVPTVLPADATVLVRDLAEGLLHAPSLAGSAIAAISEVVLRPFRAHVLCFTEIRLEERSVSTPFLYARRPALGAASPRLGDMLHAHPLVSYYADTCLDEPLLVTDVCSRSEWESTEIATELRHQFGVQDQITIPTVVTPGHVAAWVIMREEPFQEGDRDLARELQGLLWSLPAPPALPGGGSQHLGTTPTDTHLPPLTRRELQVIRLLAEGLTAYGIARRLAITPATVDKHLQHLYHKLDVHDRLAAVLAASRYGLIPAAVAPESGR